MVGVWRPAKSSLPSPLSTIAKLLVLRVSGMDYDLVFHFNIEIGLFGDERVQ